MRQSLRGESRSAGKQGPIALVLTRQNLPVLDLSLYPAIPAGVPLGGYILALILR